MTDLVLPFQSLYHLLIFFCYYAFPVDLAYYLPSRSFSFQMLLHFNYVICKQCIAGFLNTVLLFLKWLLISLDESPLSYFELSVFFFLSFLLSLLLIFPFYFFLSYFFSSLVVALKGLNKEI